MGVPRGSHVCFASHMWGYKPTSHVPQTCLARPRNHPGALLLHKTRYKLYSMLRALLSALAVAQLGAQPSNKASPRKEMIPGYVPMSMWEGRPSRAWHQKRNNLPGKKQRGAQNKICSGRGSSCLDVLAPWHLNRPTSLRTESID